MKKKSVLFINIEYLIVLFLIKFISLFPYKIASDIGRSIGRVCYYIYFKHTNITLNKLPTVCYSVNAFVGCGSGITGPNSLVVDNQTHSFNPYYSAILISGNSSNIWTFTVTYHTTSGTGKFSAHCTVQYTMDPNLYKSGTLQITQKTVQVQHHMSSTGEEINSNLFSFVAYPSLC